MAKPINLYQNQAPASMAAMGQGIAQAGANIADITMRGNEAMTKGIMGGVNTALNEYSKYKDTKSAVTASEKAYETIKSFLPKELQFAFDSQLESMGSNVATSLADRKAFWDQSNAFLGMAVKNQMEMDKQQREFDARTRLQDAGDAAARDRAVLGGQTQFDIEQLRQKYRAQQGSGVNFGLDPFGGGGAGGGAGYYNQQYGE